MNGFQVNAVGWVLAVNALALAPDESRELTGPWADLVRSHAEGMSRANPLFRLLFPRSIPLTEKSTEAFAALVDRLASVHPERFSCSALRRRRDHWALQVALGFFLSWVAASGRRGLAGHDRGLATARPRRASGPLRTVSRRPACSEHFGHFH